MEDKVEFFLLSQRAEGIHAAPHFGRISIDERRSRAGMDGWAIGHIGNRQSGGRAMPSVRQLGRSSSEAGPRRRAGRWGRGDTMTGGLPMA